MTTTKESIDKAKELLRETDKTAKQIEEETGANLKTIYYHAKRIRDAEEEKVKNGENFKSTIQQEMESAYQELYEHAAGLEEQMKEKDELIERLQGQAPINEEGDIWEKRPSVDWKAQHDDVLEKYENLEIRYEKKCQHLKHDREEYQERIDHLTKQLQVEQERANYHGKRDHHLMEILKLG